MQNSGRNIEKFGKLSFCNFPDLRNSILGIRNSILGMASHDLINRNPQFSEQLSERFPELPQTHRKDFHLPLHSRSVFSRIGVVPAHQSCNPQRSHSGKTRPPSKSTFIFPRQCQQGDGKARGDKRALFKHALFRDQKKDGRMAMFKRTFVRTIPDNLRAPYMKMKGASRQKWPRSSLELRPEHYHGIVLLLPCFLRPCTLFSARFLALGLAGAAKPPHASLPCLLSPSPPLYCFGSTLEAENHEPQEGSSNADESQIKAEKTMTATDVTGFDAIFSTGFFAIFSRF